MKEYEFTFSGPSIRLDKYLVTKLSDITRTQVQLLIEEASVKVNGQTKKANYMLKENDLVKVIILDPKPTKIVPKQMPLDIYYEDSDLIVINKPQGLVVHPAAGNKENTLVNALLFHCKDLSGINGELRAGIVHRLDKDTSGLLVACKNDYTHKHLSKQFAERKVKREYYALVNGIINHNLGLIDAPIARDKLKRQEMSVSEEGKKAVTHFEVLERFKELSLVKLRLETGRTHQIRVHMRYIGHPIYGDPVYGPQKTTSRQFLHAKILGFIHPRTNQYIEFESKLPENFEKILEDLRI